MTIHLYMCILAINTIAKKTDYIIWWKENRMFLFLHPLPPKIDIAILINKLSLIQGQRHGEITDFIINERQV